MSIITMQVIEIVTTASLKKTVRAPLSCDVEQCEKQPVVQKVAVLLPGHSHGSHGDSCADEAHTDSHLTSIIAAMSTEFSLSLHSVLIGLAVGIVPDEELTPLIVALCFHQFFEGITLGVRLDAAQLSLRTLLLGVMVFAVSAPVGIAIGIGLAQANSAFATSTQFIVALGTLEAISAGMLIHVGMQMLTKDLNADIAEHKGVGKMAALLFTVYTGFGAMAVIGKWL
jgi:zinc transporter 1/2/3